MVYGHNPPSIRAYSRGEVRIPAVDGQLYEQDEFLTEIRDRLEQAQLLYMTFYYTMSGWASFTARWHPSMSKGAASWDPSTTGHS
jgi:hypothetical protein